MGVVDDNKHKHHYTTYPIFFFFSLFTTLVYIHQKVSSNTIYLKANTVLCSQLRSQYTHLMTGNTQSGLFDVSAQTASSSETGHNTVRNSHFCGGSQWPVQQLKLTCPTKILHQRACTCCNPRSAKDTQNLYQVNVYQKLVPLIFHYPLQYLTFCYLHVLVS